MQPIRRHRLQSLILEQLAQAIPKVVKDPRVPKLSLTNVELSQDGGRANIYFSIFFQNELSDFQQIRKECLKGLIAAKGKLKQYLGKRLFLKAIPELIFKEDRGLENAQKVYELLKKISQTS